MHRAHNSTELFDWFTNTIPTWLKWCIGMIASLLAALWYIVSSIASDEVKDAISRFIPIADLISGLIMGTIVFLILVVFLFGYTFVKHRHTKDGIIQPTTIDTHEITQSHQERTTSGIRSPKLEHLEIRFLYRWYYYFVSWFKPIGPDIPRGKNIPNKRLLINTKTNEAYHAPENDLEIVSKGIIGKDENILHPFESLKKWSERHGYTYVNRRFRNTELTEE